MDEPRFIMSSIEMLQALRILPSTLIAEPKVMQFLKLQEEPES